MIVLSAFEKPLVTMILFFIKNGENFISKVIKLIEILKMRRKFFNIFKNIVLYIYIYICIAIFQKYIYTYIYKNQVLYLEKEIFRNCFKLYQYVFYVMLKTRNSM